MTAERIAIVGVGQTVHKSKRTDVNTAEMCAEAVEAALADAQLTMKDIDCVILAPSSQPMVIVVRTSGLSPKSALWAKPDSKCRTWAPQVP